MQHIKFVNWWIGEFLVSYFDVTNRLKIGIHRFRIRCLMSWARYRLHQENGRAWCAAKRAVNEWVLVDLGVASKVSGIVTQGRGDISEWVTHFMVSYSLDAYKWEFARDIYGTKKVQAVLSQIIANLLSRERAILPEEWIQNSNQ